MKILSVVPLIPLPLSILSYSVPLKKEFPEKFPFGSIVSIPLRNRSILGVVVDTLEDEKTEKVKSILGVYLLSPLLNPQTFAFLKKVANWYHIPLSKVVCAALPKPPKKRIEATYVVNKPLGEPTEPPRFLLFNQNKTLSETYRDLLLTALKKKHRVLFLVSKKIEGEKFFRIFHSIHPGTVFLDATMNPALLFHRYREFFSGKIPILIGTRKFLFWDSIYPHSVILHHAHDPLWKEERTPYFDAREIFARMAESEFTHRQLISSGVMVPFQFQIQKKWRIEDLREKRSLHFETVEPLDTYSSETLSPDPALNSIFYNSWEDLYVKLLERKASTTDGSSLQVATRKPDHPLLQFFQSGKDEYFFEKELFMRKKFHYPPFGKIIKMSFHKEKDYQLFEKFFSYKIKILHKEEHTKIKKIIFNISTQEEEENIFSELKNLKILPKIDINPRFLV